jgi:hypothetical protein
MRLTAVEWRIAALIVACGPISVFALAKALRMDYTLAKRGARGLRAWNIVTRTPDGLTFQPDRKGWAQGIQVLPVKLPTDRREPSRAPTAAAAPPPAGEEVELTIDLSYR